MFTHCFQAALLNGIQKLNFDVCQKNYGCNVFAECFHWVTCLFLSTSENDITGVLDHTFCVEHNAYGEIIQHELKPNGKSIPVTEENKKEYVRYSNIFFSVSGISHGRNFYAHEVIKCYGFCGFFFPSF